MNPMPEKLATLWPEIAMVTGACICLFTGLARSARLRQSTVWVAGTSLVVAGLLVCKPSSATPMALYVKFAVTVVGFLLLLVTAQLPSSWKTRRDTEDSAEQFSRVPTGEFFAFFLFSLTGVMLCASATDLVWLFLALELTSLPTYVMVAISRNRATAQEAAVKYFFLGALSAALFLYGFAIIYGATGFTDFARIQAVAEEGLSPLFIAGLLFAVLGVSFKIAAVPMHFYAADVYQGAATPVTAFLAFVPKTAGFVSLMWLLDLAGSSMPQEVTWLLWGIAALTMTVGNVLGLVQSSVKRALAYSSIAHSGYMLVGLLGPAVAGQQVGGPLSNGYGAVLFYLVAYGLANLGAFAVLACIESKGAEADTYENIAGLARNHPGLAAIMLVSLLSLIGLPLTVGFVGKIYLFGTLLTAQDGQLAAVSLVVIAVLNSAISAVYYLRIASACFFSEPNDNIVPVPTLARRLGAMLAALGTVVLGVAGGWLVDAANNHLPRNQLQLVCPHSAPASSNTAQQQPVSARPMAPRKPAVHHPS